MSSGPGHLKVMQLTDWSEIDSARGKILRNVRQQKSELRADWNGHV